jgi:hypothetical protein
MIRSGLATGQTVKARIDARPDLGVLAGQVAEMTPGADPASHSFQVKVALPASDLPSGAAGRASVPVDSREAVVIPANAVLRQGGLSLVVIRKDDGTAATRAVTVGASLPDQKLEVLSGLAGGETVLLGLTSLPQAGARVDAEAS